jgi:hypothetical protein
MSTVVKKTEPLYGFILSASKSGRSKVDSNGVHGRPSLHKVRSLLKNSVNLIRELITPNTIQNHVSEYMVNCLQSW